MLYLAPHVQHLGVTQPSNLHQSLYVIPFFPFLPSFRKAKAWVRWEGFSLADSCLFISTLSQLEESGAHLRISNPPSIKLACIHGTVSPPRVCMTFTGTRFLLYTPLVRAGERHADSERGTSSMKARMAKPSVTEFRLFGIDLLPSCNLCFCWIQPYLIKPKLALLGRKYLLSCTWLSELHFCKPSSLLILTWSFSHLPHFSHSVLHSWVVRDAQGMMESGFQRMNALLVRTNPTKDNFLMVRSRKGEDKAWSRAAQFSCLNRGVQRPLQEMRMGLPDVIQNLWKCCTVPERQLEVGWNSLGH